MTDMKYTKWVTTWGNATSITDRHAAVYAKDLTLRYPVRMCFDGSQLRFRFSNLTGTEPVTLTRAFVARQVAPYTPLPILFGGAESVVIEPGREVVSDAVDVTVTADETVDVSLYFADYTQLNAGTLVTGPLSKGKYSYGDYSRAEQLPLDLTRSTNWFYFLGTIDVLTDARNYALVCYGDSITAQSWPDYLTLRAADEGHRRVAIIRRAVCGTRILRQYDCLAYQAYGLKGSVRFPVEMDVAGARGVIIQHGINDIIHPVGTDVNPFRPWSDMPTLSELQAGYEAYITHARSLCLKVWSGTLLPIEGWRTYNADRETFRQAFNDYLRTTPLVDGCVDFDAALRSPDRPSAFAQGYDSGDHLHPSESAYKAMAECVPAELLDL